MNLNQQVAPQFFMCSSFPPEIIHRGNRHQREAVVDYPHPESQESWDLVEDLPARFYHGPIKHGRSDLTKGS